jgi:hypothetical protein
MSRKNLVVNMNTEISRLALKIVVMGNRELLTGNREQGTGYRLQGTGNREQGTGNRATLLFVTYVGFFLFTYLVSYI